MPLTWVNSRKQRKYNIIMKSTYLTIAILVCSVQVTVSQSNQDNLSHALSYLKAYEALDFDKMSSYYHDSVIYEDPIAEAVFKKTGYIKGKTAVVKKIKADYQQKPEYIRITVRESFSSGSYVILNQIIESLTGTGNKQYLRKGETLTVLRFENGKIIGQKEFKEYDAFNRQKIFQQTPKKATLFESQNITTALAYMKAYSAWDIDKMGSFYQDSVHFTDYTAIEAFKGSDYDHVGKNDVVNFWKGIFNNKKPDYVNITVHGVFSTANFVVLHTVFDLLLPDDWTPKSSDKVLVSLQIKTVLGFEDGKIIRHIDFANYDLYMKQMRIQTKQ